MTPQELLGSALSLAVQGKLVPQFQNEGSADALYQYLLDEKNKLVKKGLAKKSKTLSQITDEEKLFEIPDTWRWIKIGEIASLITKGTTPRGGNVSYLDAGIGFLRAENVAGLDRLDKDNLKYIDEETHYSFLKRSILEANDILITIAGTLGRTAIVREDDLPLNANQAVSMIRLVDPYAVNLTYLVYALNSPEIQRYLTKQKKVTAIPNLTLEIIENCLLPLPPLDEQKRIVAKIEEILPLIDRYEAAWNKLEEFNKRFPGDMQKSILQLAIQGKLVEQRPEEGTGEDLFQLIQKEKQSLIKAGKIKKEKPMPEIDDDKIPFDIPDSWKWVRLGDVASINGGFAFKSTNYTNSGVRVVRISDFNEKGFVNDKIVRHPYVESLSQYVLEEKNILLCMTGGTVGKSLFVTELDERMVVNQRVATIKVESVLPEYVYQVILAPVTQKVIQHSKNSTNDNISMDTIKDFLIPLPPLKEQKRIVAKLEEILPLCDRLK